VPPPVPAASTCTRLPLPGPACLGGDSGCLCLHYLPLGGFCFYRRLPLRSFPAAGLGSGKDWSGMGGFHRSATVWHCLLRLPPLTTTCRHFLPLHAYLGGFLGPAFSARITVSYLHFRFHVEGLPALPFYHSPFHFISTLPAFLLSSLFTDGSFCSDGGVFGATCLGATGILLFCSGLGVGVWVTCTTCRSPLLEYHHSGSCFCSCHSAISITHLRFTYHIVSTIRLEVHSCDSVPTVRWRMIVLPTILPFHSTILPAFSLPAPPPFHSDHSWRISATSPAGSTTCHHLPAVLLLPAVSFLYQIPGDFDAILGGTVLGYHLLFH